MPMSRYERSVTRGTVSARSPKRPSRPLPPAPAQGADRAARGPAASRQPALAGHGRRACRAARMARRPTPGSHHPGGRRHAQRRAGAAVGASNPERPGTATTCCSRSRMAAPPPKRARSSSPPTPAKSARSTHRLEPGASAFVSASIPASARCSRHAAARRCACRRRRDRPRPRAAAQAASGHRFEVSRRARWPRLARTPPLPWRKRDATDVEAVLDCGTRGAARDVATLRVLADRTPTRLRGSVQWSSSVPESRRISARHRSDCRSRRGCEPRPADAVLLAVGDEPLIVSRAGTPKLLETSLDFGSAETRAVRRSRCW